ncbi:ABC-2 type transport system ATP-binding protein [Clostridium sp. DSM 8431]|uniref:ABC transporter ATP-binding protein n=1 Tax=Clostridium sp. DSM 8431 TaxID=1761781 RepID=UPI0008EDCB98|nr:ABC transporter ATP-binding protein [Clostridium sp. DSM 8431]SFU87231.1 ABC-2 type transport system ATP-binding protein [Clostridium sp. DSM 8431]
MNNTVIVKIKNLSKKVSNIDILNDISVEFKKGTIYGIVGKNGSGKTMLFKSICGLINPTSGEITVLDRPIKNGTFPKETGIIIENPGFLPQYSAFENLKILASINNKVDDETIKKYINLVTLDAENKKTLKTYSLGMKQKLGIAQALMENPKLLILDEPMNALDEESVILIRKLLLNLKNQGVTILLSSHNKVDIDELCDHIYTMDSGKLILD